MDNDAYTQIETPFREAAKPLMAQLRTELLTRGSGPFSEVEEIDRDIERGLGFSCTDNPDQFVDLMLTDNDSHGAEGVGLILTCSVYGSGQVWAPGNFTEDFAMTSAEEVLERLSHHFDSSEIADRISREWERLADAHQPPESMRGA